ncbi:MAG: PIG-L family deacetylase [Spirochaetaceae bacterium]|nr:PIG-L family deacetylase [Spirochaetaceae bacterium]
MVAALLGLIALLLIAFAVSRYYQNRSSLEEPHPQPQMFHYLDLILLSPEKGKQQEFSLPGPKIIAGTVQDADLKLRKQKGNTRPEKFSIETRETGVFFSSPDFLLINGVAAKHKKLSPGSRIAWGSERILFKGTHNVIVYPKKKPDFLPTYSLPIFAVLLTLVAGLALQSLSGTIESETSNTVTKTAYPALYDAAKEFGSLPLLKPHMIGPGETPEYFDADIMCIHAHPDDESIDFGGFTAKASRQGKKIITVLFTDGESGVVRSDFPGQYPSPPELAEIRVGETEKALSHLGVVEYLRLGLKNHPYSSNTQVLSIEEVLDAWGGEAGLITKLTELIRGYSPSVILSPKNDSEAYEHFEHKTVGYLVNKAIDQLMEEGQSFIKGHLIPVDSLRDTIGGEPYPAIAAISMMETAVTGFSPKRIKAQALRQYRTQKDASIIALAHTLDVQYEYYSIELWNYPITVEEYLSGNE